MITVNTNVRVEVTCDDERAHPLYAVIAPRTGCSLAAVIRGLRKEGWRVSLNGLSRCPDCKKMLRGLLKRPPRYTF